MAREDDYVPKMSCSPAVLICFLLTGLSLLQVSPFSALTTYCGIVRWVKSTGVYPNPAGTNSGPSNFNTPLLLSIKERFLGIDSHTGRTLANKIPSHDATAGFFPILPPPLFDFGTMVLQ